MSDWRREYDDRERHGRLACIRLRRAEIARVMDTLRGPPCIKQDMGNGEWTAFYLDSPYPELEAMLKDELAILDNMEERILTNGQHPTL